MLSTLKPWLPALAIFLLTPAASLHARQQPDSVRIFLDSSLNVLQFKSVFAGKVNWTRVRDSVRLMTSSAQRYEDVHTAIQYAFNQLGDKHGYLVFNGQSYRNPAFVFDTTRLTTNMKEAAKKGPQLYTDLIDHQFAYLSIPFFGGQSVADVKLFAQRIQDSLCRHISPGTKGIIIDLRLNAGGNVFPMIAGIANVLGDGAYGKGLNAAGQVTEEYILKKGAVRWYDSIPLKTERSCGDLSRLPVALLLGPTTASAGEDIAIAFTGRKRAVLIGEVTGGYVTANDGFYLPGHKNGIVVAVGYLTDRKGKKYLDDVVPNITVVGGDHFFEREKDEKIKAAVQWLRKQR